MIIACNGFKFEKKRHFSEMNCWVILFNWAIKVWAVVNSLEVLKCGKIFLEEFERWQFEEFSWNFTNLQSRHVPCNFRILKI